METGKPSMFRGAAGRSAVASLTVLLLTSVHHAYGAFIYRTPWRLHMVGVAAVTAVVLLGALALSRARWAFFLFALTTLAVPVGMVGAFEGFYNHVLKNVFYFGGASVALLERLFPPPTYELPNDFFFELTGVLQVVPAVLALVQLLRAFRRATCARSTGTTRAASS
ncbi:hypothetical protein [Pyxidicoccus sp. MSG2]|uniref:hypothetical protein n=1 Tax=Pyxidicoccus sp. MSG2 TaxID=2996790 RepID=UPI00226E0B9E|nr:hypothetical protein [Pyxidicoccus sp. MSG2]MCY1019963.1 hypothetical protein [Pyxidicoccus sp. MSG2]